MVDFLGAIIAGQADSYLYEIAFSSPRDELRLHVAELSSDEQTVLLLPYFSDDFEDLARERDIDEWGQCLRSDQDVCSVCRPRLPAAALNSMSVVSRLRTSSPIAGDRPTQCPAS